MKREAYHQLSSWKKDIDRKPLIIRGARQVGKTWLMKEFGATEYQNTIYINFEDNTALQSLFLQDFDIDRILLSLQIETGIKAEADHCLIILDEIQEAPQGITSLKYFYEKAPQYHVMAAGSYLGISLHRTNSFPVGKVNFINLRPLSFNEYLRAKGQSVLLELIQNKQWNLISQFKNKYILLLKEYYFIGGMPEVVANFIKNNDFDKARKIQLDIINSYEQDFSKHAPTNIIPRIRMVWNSIPAQLAKENKKFIFSMLKKGARSKDFELALEWLIDSGLLHKVNRIKKPSIPLKAYEDISAFKIYLNDCGLLCTMAQLPAKTLLNGNQIFQEFKGALTEQYAHQQLIQYKPYYWSAENSSGEIDFLLQLNETIIPIEVKSEENLKAKSLKSFVQKHKSETAIRTSMSDYREESWLINIPLYALDIIGSLA
jgi:predicted AAA+ superfamily ATPase